MFVLTLFNAIVKPTVLVIYLVKISLRGAIEGSPEPSVICNKL